MEKFKFAGAPGLFKEKPLESTASGEARAATETQPADAPPAIVSEKIKVAGAPRVLETLPVQQAEKAGRAAESAKSATVAARLNDGRFMEFLALYPDAKSMDMSDTEALNKRFESFTAAEEVARDLGKVFSEKIKTEMGFELKPEDLVAYSKDIQRRAVESPDDMAAFQERLRLMKELPAQIAALEGTAASALDIRVLERQADQLKAEKQAVSITRKSLEFGGIFALLFRSREAAFDRTGAATFKGALEAQGMVRQKYGAAASFDKLPTIAADIDARLKALQLKLIATKNATELKGQYEVQFGLIRKDLFQAASETGDITQVIQNRARESVKKLLGSKDLASLEKASDQFTKLVERSQDGSETGIDPLAGMDIENVQKQMDAAIGKRVSEDIAAAIQRMKPGKNAFTSLEQTLGRFLAKQKIGSKQGVEARQFVIGQLDKARTALGESTDDKMKHMMLSRIMVRAQDLSAYAPA